MPVFTFHMGVTLRCYGDVNVEAETIEAAKALLTADYLGEELVQVDQGDNAEENKEIARLVCAQINAMHLPFAQVTEELIENQIKSATAEVRANG